MVSLLDAAAVLGQTGGQFPVGSTKIRVGAPCAGEPVPLCSLTYGCLVPALFRGHMPKSSGKKSEFIFFFWPLNVNWISVSHFSPCATNTFLEKVQSGRSTMPTPHHSFPGAVCHAAYFPNDATQPLLSMGREVQGTACSAPGQCLNYCKGAVAVCVVLVLAYPQGQVNSWSLLLAVQHAVGSRLPSQHVWKGNFGTKWCAL